MQFGAQPFQGASILRQLGEAQLDYAVGGIGRRIGRLQEDVGAFATEGDRGGLGWQGKQDGALGIGFQTVGFGGNAPPGTLHAYSQQLAMSTLIQLTVIGGFLKLAPIELLG
jgi:hypothetical protein